MKSAAHYQLIYHFEGYGDQTRHPLKGGEGGRIGGAATMHVGFN